MDAIFTGHTHKQYAWDAPVPGEAGVTRPIIQTGDYGENIGEVTLTYDPATDEVTAHTEKNIPRLVAPVIAGNTPAQNEAAFAAQLVATYPRVAQVKTIVDAALAYADTVGSVPVGSVTADITTAYTGGTYGPAATSAPARTPPRVATTGRASRRSATSSPTPCGTPSPRRTSAARRSASSTRAACGPSCSTRRTASSPRPRPTRSCRS